MPRLITSHSNETLKRVRALRDKKHRRAEGLFLAEGLRIITEAVEAGHLPRLLIYAQEAAAHPLVARLGAQVEAAGGEAIETTRDILLKLAEKDNPQAVLGVFPVREHTLADIDRSASFVWIVCEALKDPGNLGTILRTSDAVGAGGVILLDNSCDPHSVEAVRASMGALFTQTVVQTEGAAFFAWLRAGPGMLVGASLNTDTDYQVMRYAAPTFLFMGNEQSGLPPAYEAQCDALVKIPMQGKADSLNVAVSCAVLLYEVFNQRRADPSGRAG
jgi:RNA methyltransferase, TrmH family